MLVEVALPVPLPRTFTYRLDGQPVAVGTRVRVPFGPRRLVGWTVGEAAAVEPSTRLRDVEAVLDEQPTLPADLLQLCRWIADYYLCPIGQVIRSALPAVLSDGARPAPYVRTRRLLQIARDLPSLMERDELFRRSPRQRECYEFLEASGGVAEVAHLMGQLNFSPGVLRALVRRGLAVEREERLERDPFANMAVAPPPELVPTTAQAAAIEALVAGARAGGDPSAGPLSRAPAGGSTLRESIPPFLLRGVTGSGKTLVYIELLKEVVRTQGRGAIVLVPEIALTPQTVARFRSHFGDAVAVLHSALSDGERYDAWRALQRGEKRIAVGARSAIFAPIPDLGAIVLDEEHEGSYKQSEAPRYHAREVAIMRARLNGAVCVLGSATPSLESWHNAARGKFTLLELPERVEGRPLPPVSVVDLRQRPGAGTAEGGSGGGGERGQPGVAGGRDSSAAGRSAATVHSAGGRPSPTPPLSRSPARPESADRVLSEPLVAAIADRLRKREQTILLLNRRGYSTFVQCRDCGTVRQCRNCNVSLTYHRSNRRMVCHYCFHEEPPPLTCEGCGSADLSFRGMGTEQVERTLAETFPTARLARMDVDTTSGKWSHHEILSRVERGEVDILLGTQMIAKGLDFPRVTLVGVINADVGMNLPDFRASERTFQLLTQVSGRAGRGELGGEVLVQTALPGHYAIRAALEHDFSTFAARELEERRGPGYPPYTRLLNVVLSGTHEEAVQLSAQRAAKWTEEAIRAGGAAGAVALLGPAPCAVDRIRGRWRWHFLLRSRSPQRLARVARRLQHDFELRPGPADLRLVLDRDPISLL